MPLYLYRLINLNRYPRLISLCSEAVKYKLTLARVFHRFAVVSCGKFAADYAEKCLDSVYRQRYNGKLLRHFVIDDCSDDGTEGKIRNWLKAHPENSVEYVRNERSLGGSYNTIAGLRKALDCDILVELDLDDAFPDCGVIPFLNKVYQDPGVWMTYNTMKINNAPSRISKRLPNRVIAENAIRKYNWVTQPLHSFRRFLMDSLDDRYLIDPETGKYWELADDQAIYMTLFELCGRRVRHINRITYLCNMHGQTSEIKERGRQVEISNRIRALAPASPLKNNIPRERPAGVDLSDSSLEGVRKK